MEQRDIQIIRSTRRSVSLEIKPDLRILLRAPYQMTEEEIRRFVKEKAGWIETHIEKMAARKEEREGENEKPKLSAEELAALAEEAAKIIPQRVRHYAPLVGVEYGKITIRNQRTRWGSCSGKGNLNFNCLLMKTPPKVVDYVVVHELCHRLEMNHSARFWAQVERVYPDYKQALSWLKANGSAIVESMIVR